MYVIFKPMISLRRGRCDFSPRTLKGLVMPLGNNNNCHRLFEGFENNTYTATLNLIFLCNNSGLNLLLGPRNRTA